MRCEKNAGAGRIRGIIHAQNRLLVRSETGDLGSCQVAISRPSPRGSGRPEAITAMLEEVSIRWPKAFGGASRPAAAIGRARAFRRKNNSENASERRRR
jgi:hypothetical protein